MNPPVGPDGQIALSLLAAADAAGHLDDLAVRRAHRDLEHARLGDVAADADPLEPLAAVDALATTTPAPLARITGT